MEWGIVIWLFISDFFIDLDCSIGYGVVNFEIYRFFFVVWVECEFFVVLFNFLDGKMIYVFFDGNIVVDIERFFDSLVVR